MARGRRIALIAASAVLALGSLAVAGCGDDDEDATATSGGGDAAALSGNIVIDGSSTVAPLTSAAAEDFAADNGDVNITVGTSGTGGGFERFCTGETDISNASRAIEDDEVAACEAGGVAYEELRVASDGITIVTSSNADVGGTDITSAQLKAIWGPKSTIKNWSDIPGGDFNDVPLALAGPDSQSGTYDFFNEEILGEDAAGETVTPRQDYTASADDNVIVRAVQSGPGTMGYFGFTYYEENADTLAPFTLDGVEPTTESITDGSYPLSRPLFIYVKTASLEKPEVKAFVRYYLENATALAEDLQFVPAPQDALDEALARVPE
ncbi:phosphate ABC transporter substrate-binding protein PstS family protein [Miltoncostaea oceani]|uniref:phosphate ABC transporter substrate-binding protein PstS family protein n=1 Tax=Miltoncostaea oceani TaxID=2843216 RepID=UPI001C3C6CB4|nr:phosphate ABC transporter substrate-binding protein PstS family protein [Miltoncostaea oceani]